MDLYQVTFTVLVVTSLCLAWRHHRHEFKTSSLSGGNLESGFDRHGDPTRFRNIFFAVYVLIMGSDWLQGAYVYTLYKDEKDLPETTVARLFTCGFLSAAISALFVGSLADTYGRRLACLTFCVIYAVGCVTKISDDVTILFIGRLLGGVSTTLMYSVFESWMVTEYFAQNLDKSWMSLDSIFGIMSTLNSTVAIISGLAGEGLVAATGTKVSPFLAAVLCLGLAFWIMKKTWGENYGDSASLKELDIPEKSTIKLLLQDKRILVLGLISCCFEGSMYLFIFYWSAAMKSVHFRTLRIAGDQDAANISFGIIFATFMASMMLGSLGFTYASSASSSSRFSIAKFFMPSWLLTLSIAGACLALLLTVLLKIEHICFWAFCAFEACVGIYYPSMAAQRAVIVDDGIRAKIYSILRIPLNVFVVVALLVTVEGDAHRDKMFLICAGLLLLASLAAGYFLDEDKVVEVDDEDANRRVD